MNRRLQQFLEAENLTAAKLADILGVQRSGLSHILSARNKPSYDFILTILNKYPALNPDWLITGKGKMYRDQNEDSTPVHQVVVEKSEHIQPPQFEFENEVNSEEPISDTTPLLSTKAPSNNKRIVRITIYYSDGTFEDR